MQAKANCRESSTAPSKPRVSLGLEAVVKSMWSCPSMCSEASSHSHASDALGGDQYQAALTAREEALAGIIALKESLGKGNSRPTPGIVIEPFNIKVIPPCKDCQFIDYNWDDLIAQAGSDSTDHVSGPAYEGKKAEDFDSSVPLTENFPGYGVIDRCGGCFGCSNYHFEPPCCKELLPLALHHLFKQTSTTNGGENKAADGALSEKMDSNLKL
ncbi:hypothetical protein QQP08_016475 [Theobroma cacao]|uniref:Uncharacterized protein n=1 Tax=Theobroma cacao TaxID=3641 RepID=A0A061F4U3_THECC|nr:Uncharacterized protein TCM_024959 [Theobroma cacao]WRX23988.1 hypothetical protein QQP08_016475 [Theobroma cacao]